MTMPGGHVPVRLYIKHKSAENIVPTDEIDLSHKKIGQLLQTKPAIRVTVYP